MWIEITEALVLTKLTSPELAAMSTAARGQGQAVRLPEVITQIVNEVRGYVGSCAQNTLGDGATIPDELLGAAISRIRFELATALPVASLLTSARETANSSAVTLLRDVAACRFSVIQPATAATDQAGGPNVETITTTERRYGRTNLAGL